MKKALNRVSFLFVIVMILVVANLGISESVQASLNNGLITGEPAVLSNIIVNAKPIISDVQPVSKNGFILVPLRSIAEDIGAKVEWQADKKAVNLDLDSEKINVIIGRNEAYINKTQKSFNYPPEIINNRTFVPINFVREVLDAEVTRDDETGTVYITFEGSSRTNPQAIELADKLRTVSTVEQAYAVIDEVSFADFNDNDIYEIMAGAICNRSLTNNNLKNVQKKIAENGHWIGKYYQEDMQIIWPPNNGFQGIPTTKNFSMGDRFDRYGYQSGSFASPFGTPYACRSVAPGTKETRPYHKYKVIAVFSAQEGIIAPWFGKPGGGIQYFFGNETVQNLLDEKKIVEIKNNYEQN